MTETKMTQKKKTPTFAEIMNPFKLPSPKELKEAHDKRKAEKQNS